RLHHDLAVAQARAAVREAELTPGQPGAALGRRDERAREHLRELAAVGAGVHLDAAADRAGNRAGELEAAEARAARAVQAYGVGGAGPGAYHLAVDLDGGESAAEPEHERVHALVGDEEVRAEPDGRDGEPALGAPAQQLLDLGERLGPCERAGGAAGAERRVPREGDPLLHVHASASSSSGAARSTSPAPSVRTVSPGRAQPATSRAPSSTSGAQPTRIPGRTRASS